MLWLAVSEVRLERRCQGLSSSCLTSATSDGEVFMQCSTCTYIDIWLQVRGTEALQEFSNYLMQPHLPEERPEFSDQVTQLQDQVRQLTQKCQQLQQQHDLCSSQK